MRREVIGYWLWGELACILWFVFLKLKSPDLRFLKEHPSGMNDFHSRNLQEDGSLLVGYRSWVSVPRKEMHTLGNTEPGRRMWGLWKGPGAGSKCLQVPMLYDPTSGTYFTSLGLISKSVKWVKPYYLYFPKVPLPQNHSSLLFSLSDWSKLHFKWSTRRPENNSIFCGAKRIFETVVPKLFKIKPFKKFDDRYGSSNLIHKWSCTWNFGTSF